VTTQDVGVGEKKKERKEKKEEEESSLAVSLPSSIIGARRASRNRTGDRRGARRGDGVCPESNFVMPSCCLRAHLARSRVSQAAHNFVACNKVAGCCSCGKQPPRYPCCYSSLSLSLSIPPTLPLFILSTALLLPAFVSIAIQPLRSALDAMAARSSTQLALDANRPACLLPIATPLSLSSRYIDASIAIASTRNLEKSPLPLRVRVRNCVRCGGPRKTTVARTAVVRSPRGAEIPPAFPSFAGIPPITIGPPLAPSGESANRRIGEDAAQFWRRL